MSAPYSPARADKDKDDDDRAGLETVEIRKSSFKEKDRRLRVDAKIKHVPKGAANAVRLFDDMTGNLLAEKISKKKKEVEFRLDGFSETNVPCRVRVEVEDLSVVALVKNTPTRCGEGPRIVAVTVEEARFKTSKGDLKIEGEVKVEKSPRDGDDRDKDDKEKDNDRDREKNGKAKDNDKDDDRDREKNRKAKDDDGRDKKREYTVRLFDDITGRLVAEDTDKGKKFEIKVKDLPTYEVPCRVRAVVDDVYAVRVVRDAPPDCSNFPPVADGGLDQSIPVGGTAALDGAGSSDRDKDPLTYTWSLLSTPAGSGAALSNTTAISPTLFIDLPGTYVARLVVNDTKVDSPPAMVTITTTAPVVQITSPGDGALFGASPITVSGTVNDPTASVVVNGVTAAVTGTAASGGTFTASVPLVESANTLAATATDTAGKTGSDSVGVTLDTTPPVVTISSPANGSQHGTSEITVAGTVIDANSPPSVTVNGVSVPLTGGVFTTTVTLQDGANPITVSATDLAGNAGSASVSVLFLRDTAPPVVTITTPADGFLTGNSEITVSGTVSDDHPPPSVTVNGATVPLTSGAFTTTVALQEGANPITVSATDLAGNTGEAGVSVSRDTTPPVITITSFGDGALRGDNPTIVTGTVADAHLPSTVTVNGLSVPLTGDFFTAQIPLQEGANTITVGATDQVGNAATKSVSVTLDTIPPEIVIDSPTDGATFGVNTVTVSGSVSDLHPPDSVAVNGVIVPLSGATFSTDVSLVGGLNTIWVAATDQADNNGLATVAVSFAVITITSPDTLITVGSSPLQVSGTIGDPGAALTVNGAPVAHGGGTFSASVSLKEGLNTIVARAVSVGGGETTDSIVVSLDKTPPQVTIDSPTAGQVFTTETIAVTGLVNDIVRGTISDGQANVTVNGIPATVSNRTYLAENVPLQIGDNTITVATADQVGNTASASVTVRRNPALGNRIALVSGQGQTARIRTALPAPLQVRLINGVGIPVPGKNVVFRVIQGDGVVGVGSSKEAQAVSAVGDANGIAATPFRLGSRAGNGNHKVRATAVGFQGEIVFHANAEPNPGDKIGIIAGNNQRGAVNAPLPQPLVVAVTDLGANLIANSDVRFTVTTGGGRFANGQKVITTKTDTDGRASAELTIGPNAGIDVHRVTALLVGTTATAGFTASGLIPGDPGQTSISGVVLDNQDNPVPGVTVRVDGTTRQGIADSQGQFKITEVPVGPVHLLADGSTATVPGEWPTLSYNIVTVAGAVNPLPAPIYMVKLDLANSQVVGLTDVEYTLPQIPGFKLKVAAGSVTFPGGAKFGNLSVTPVNANKIPMAPPNGMQPQFIVTIQPTGAKFDPPAPLQLPNVDGHAPGAQVEMFSYDHDLEEFVTIGLGTVSADGTVIASDSGVGVIKAGWHCGTPPSGSGCTHNCPLCQDCDADCNCSIQLVSDPRLADLADPQACKKHACNNGRPTQVADLSKNDFGCGTEEINPFAPSQLKVCKFCKSGECSFGTKNPPVPQSCTGLETSERLDCLTSNAMRPLLGRNHLVTFANRGKHSTSILGCGGSATAATDATCRPVATSFHYCGTAFDVRSGDQCNDLKAEVSRQLEAQGLACLFGTSGCVEGAGEIGEHYHIELPSNGAQCVRERLCGGTTGVACLPRCRWVPLIPSLAE